MKKEYFLLVVVIIGLGALLFYQKKGSINYKLPELPILQETADRLLIEKAGELTELRLVDGKWVVGEQQYRAHADRVKKMIAVVKDLKLTALISEKENYQIYDLVPDKRLKISLFAGDHLLREIQVGKNSASLRQTYVMIKGDPKVYQALGNLKSNLFSDVADLRDKKVLEISAEKLAGIDEITVERMADGKRQVLKVVKLKPEPLVNEGKDDKASVPVAIWQEESGAHVATGEVDKLLKNIATLQCESFIEDRGPEAFSDPLYQVVARGDGNEFSLALLAPEDDKYPALSSQSPEPFWLPSWRAEKIIKIFSAKTSSGKKAESK